MTPAIEAADLSVCLEGNRILSDLTFAVHHAEFFILIGPNGSGKTTLMRTLAGLLPVSGSLRILGKPSSSYTGKEIARHIAYVPQQLPSDFPFTVEEVVLMGRAPHQGILGIAAKADLEIAYQAMTVASVAHLAGRRLNRLSGGELQRVFIARALCQEPEIILLDEPTSFLDMGHQIRVLDLLERLKQEKGMTVVMISHDINLAAMYGDRLALMKGGRFESIGKAGEVLTFDTIENVYDCCVLVDQNPMGDFPRVVPVPGRILSLHRRLINGK
jgi:iron complex transport system ATP-binding protein